MASYARSSLLSLAILALHSTAFCVAGRYPLPPGFHFSPSMLNRSSLGYGDLPAGICFPLPPSSSSSSLISSNTPVNGTETSVNGTETFFGFGFWATSTATEDGNVQDMHLGVCRLVFEPICRDKECNQYNSNLLNIIKGSDKQQSSVSLQTRLPSSAALIWTANASRSLTSLNASLDLGRDSRLTLTDADGTVLWNVENVAAMELLDSGNLVIYDSKNAVIWQSFDHPTDTLVQNQTLRLGMQLISKDSIYFLEMKPGGLVFYMAASQLPYWIILASDHSTNLSDAPCSAANGSHATPVDINDSFFRLFPGSCLPNDFIDFELPKDGAKDTPCAFLRLQTDGRLYCYSQSADNGFQPVLALDRAVISTSVGHSVISPYQNWGMCDVPLACGPYGVCSVQGECVCPPSQQNDSTFAPLNDPSSSTCSLPVASSNCVSEGEPDQQSFLEINNTATILLFSGATSADGRSFTLDDCKHFCCSNHACTGVIYMKSISSCFPFLYGVSLLNVSSSPHKSETAQNYAAYLKISQSDGQPPMTSPNSVETIKAVLVTVLVSTFVLLSVGLVLFRIAMQKRRGTGLSQYRALEQELLHILPCLPRRFSYRDLHRATRGFNHLLGEGGFGAVYAGVLSDGRQVAVKKLNITSLHDRQFLAEVATTGQTNHFNIVPLVGFCSEISNRLLVYELMEKGSLDRWLFNVAEDGNPLDWATRYNIAIGVARGLAYLHDDCLKPILHLDIKPQNILLDRDFVPKLADFGLSRLITRDTSQVVTMGRGTPGYIAPELCLSQAAVSKKSDVYSLGMVLLEIVGGRKNIDISMLVDANATVNAEQWHFPSWAARKCKEGRLADLVDARLEGAFQPDEARRIIEAALWCLQEDPRLRPAAGTVSKWLEGSSRLLEEPPFATVAYSRLPLEGARP